VTTGLRNVVNDITDFQAVRTAIVVNGDLQGMNTRFGDIQFALDFFITARDFPAQSVIDAVTGLSAVNPNLSAPASVTATASGAASSGVSNWLYSFVPAGNQYEWAVAAMDSSMTESTLTYSNVITGVVSGGQVSLAIAPTGSAAVVFRVYRSGLGYNLTTGQQAWQFRYVGEVIANGSSTVTFIDLNAHQPGSDTLFLLDLDEEDNALDYRYLLPLTKIDLYASALYMPWCVAHIGAPRLRVPKFNAMITNYLPLNAQWSALRSNLTVL
jgi:hypothetical protein